MSSSDASDRDRPAQPQDKSPPDPPDSTADAQPKAEDTLPSPQRDEPATEAAAEAGGEMAQPGPKTSRRRILIGSQRDPAAYRARRVRDWIPLPEPGSNDQEQPEAAAPAAPQPAPAEPPPPARQEPREAAVPAPEAPPETPAEQEPPGGPAPAGRFPPPNIREALSPELEDEFQRALADASAEELMTGGDSLAGQQALEPESRHTGCVVAVQRDDVFVELGGREQGCLPLKQFDEPPPPGTTLEVVVRRFDPEEGLYELTRPDRAVEVDDWADLREGMLVEARVTGHNTGGLECEVNHIRGFIPVSQVAMYRVEDLAELVGQKFTCLVTEAKPQRRNLVLSRRAVLEREKEEARQKLLDSLQPGQIHEGVVRKLVDFGAFVDIGGLDGLLHVSQLSWGRIEHPRDVLSEGQAIKVKIEKVDHATGKMSLGYRDLLESPWVGAATRYPPNSIVEGVVVKTVDFGAFVELEPGVEGLVHISELSHKRVWRTTDVVKQGDKVQALVRSVDTESRRISLSMKEAMPEPEPEKKKDEPAPEGPPTKPRKRKLPEKPLQGGLGRVRGGDKFGLNW